jgi:peptidoglycan-associated lipoprotein
MRQETTKMMRDLALTFFATLLGVTAAAGQQTTTDMEAVPSRVDLAAGYNFIKANAPPGSCGCFSMNGGFVGADFNLNRWFSVAGEATAGHAKDISSLGQNLTLTTFLAGPRVSWVHERYVPFVQFMAGGAHGSGSYFPSGSSSSNNSTGFAYSTGGGLELNLTDRFAIRAVDVEYLHTTFPNGENTSQNQLEIGAGIVVRFGTYRRMVHASAPPPEPVTPEVTFSCQATNPEVQAGHSVQIVGTATLVPNQGEVAYTWATAGGAVEGEGRMIAINTTNLAPGTYRVEGRAALTTNSAVVSSCVVTFEVKQREMGQQNMPTKVEVSPVGNYDDDPREHLHDIFFNYDKADLRTDGEDAVAKDAAYLISRPDITITLAGYADERGSAEYNIALGLQRAIATRDALIAAGVQGPRIQVMSYGKEKPFCTEEAESCYQQNRRAQFVIQGK